MTFDPKLALTFAVVADALSFTRAAETLGVAQPWVSGRIRRLEDQLGFQLLERTSRRVELTPMGLKFLSAVRPLVEANDSAQQFARTALVETDRTLRVGASETWGEIPERIALIDRFVQANPAAHLEIQVGPVPQLLAALKSGGLDVVLAYTTSGGGQDEFHATIVSRRYAYLMAPEDDPLAALKSVSLTSLAGRDLVCAPGRNDPRAAAAALEPFIRAGAELCTAPETNRTTIQHYALIRRLPYLQWIAAPAQVTHVPGMVCIPFAGDRPCLENAILRTTSPPRRIVESFCAVGRSLAADACSQA